ncbi:MAG: hypothetical protein JSS75_04125 [Bacteroidetes bacterium]|nr:hypothetical protein [Bacteroidota bacterium]
MTEHVTFACDIGSTRRGRFGWVRIADDTGVASHPTTGSDISGLVEALANDLIIGHKVSLGIEAPLFIPIPDSATELSIGREHEGDRSCFAPAGSAVALLMLHQMAWMFRQLSSSLRARCLDLKYCFALEEWGESPGTLLIWEAFVSRRGHHENDADRHVRDALLAAKQFRQQFSNGWPHYANTIHIRQGSSSLSLIDVALLYATASADIAGLHRSNIQVVSIP